MIIIIIIIIIITIMILMMVMMIQRLYIPVFNYSIITTDILFVFNLKLIYNFKGNVMLNLEKLLKKKFDT